MSFDILQINALTLINVMLRCCEGEEQRKALLQMLDDVGAECAVHSFGLHDRDCAVHSF